VVKGIITLVDREQMVEMGVGGDDLYPLID
jgi:hypothetical protein